MSSAALTITSRNCMAVTGMAWQRVLRFAREHDVPVLQLSARTTAINGAAFMAALERAGCAAGARKPDALDVLLSQR